MTAKLASVALIPLLALATPVSAAEGEVPKGKVVSCKGAKTSDWNAWNDLMPPPPDHFHITGKVEVAHSGITPVLTERVPPGINPTILILDLTLYDRGGISTPRVETKEVRFDKALAAGQKYAKASIHCEHSEIESVPVSDAH